MHPDKVLCFQGLYGFWRECSSFLNDCKTIENTGQIGFLGISDDSSQIVVTVISLQKQHFRKNIKTRCLQNYKQRIFICRSITELREELRRLVIARACHDVRIDEQTKILINPSGRFVLGGFEADTGLTGRKLMVDTYGGLVPHGGGALSGKDGTKVDRSGAYMARYVAKNIVAAGLADVCTVSLAYAIGQAEPVAVEIDTQESGYYDDAFLTEAVRSVFDFTPTGMIRALDLDKPFFAEVCNNCHFMHPQAAWEQTDKTEKLRMACAELEDERGQN